jgi:hypothetical protein
MAATTTQLTTGSTWKGSAFANATSFGISEEGASTDLVTDGSRFVGGTIVDSKKATVTVEVSDMATVTGANWRVGQKGALVLKMIGRSEGDSAGAAITATFGEAVLLNVSYTSPTQGSGSGTVTFSVYDTNNDGSLVAYS